MNYVSSKNDLEFGSDIKIHPEIQTYNQFSEYLDNNKNHTYFGVVFCFDYLDVRFNEIKVDIPCQPQFIKEGQFYKFYTIVYNMTNGPNDFLQMPYEPRKKNPLLMKLKLDIDNAYIKRYHDMIQDKSEIPKINITYSNYPRTEHRYFAETSMVNNVGAPFFFLIPMTLYIITLIDIVREKQYQLRKSLIIIGLTNTAFWSSWLILALMMSSLVTLIFLGLAYILSWELFLNTPFPIMFALFFLFSYDLQLCAFLMGTFLNNVKTAYSSAFVFIVVAGVIVIVFTNPFMFQVLYDDDEGAGIIAFKVFLYIFCPYSFAKAYNDIASIASTKLNEVSMMNTYGRKYEYSDLFNIKEGKTLLGRTHYTIPATYQCFIFLIVDGIIYSIFIFYFDIIIESNRGKSKSPIFFIYDLMNLFGCKSKQENLIENVE